MYSKFRLYHLIQFVRVSIPYQNIDHHSQLFYAIGISVFSESSPNSFLQGLASLCTLYHNHKGNVSL